jgi:hypothetical protein
VATPPIDAELSSWQAINTSNNVADFEAFLILLSHKAAVCSGVLD